MKTPNKWKKVKHLKRIIMSSIYGMCLECRRIVKTFFLIPYHHITMGDSYLFQFPESLNEAI